MRYFGQAERSIAHSAKARGKGDTFRGLAQPRRHRTKSAKHKPLALATVMKTAEQNRAIMIMVFVMVAFNTVFLSANGLFMLVAPMPWYNLVPGVTDTGFFNQHFIRDIGIIQLFIGVAFVGMFASAASGWGQRPYG
jgi:hypothetical protein